MNKRKIAVIITCCECPVFIQCPLAVKAGDIPEGCMLDDAPDMNIENLQEKEADNG